MILGQPNTMHSQVFHQDLRRPLTNDLSSWMEAKEGLILHRFASVLSTIYLQHLRSVWKINLSVKRL